jgi:hypothetical protein
MGKYFSKGKVKKNNKMERNTGSNKKDYRKKGNTKRRRYKRM